MCVELLNTAVFLSGSRLKACLRARAADQQWKLPEGLQYFVTVHIFVFHLSCNCKEMREQVYVYVCFFRQTCFNYLTCAPAA
jgi:hypothetical protein